MYYKKKETYTFSLPREHQIYLDFKERLKESGVSFLEEGGGNAQTITITVSSRMNTFDEVIFKED